MVQVEENADLDVGGNIKGHVVGGKVSDSGCECGGRHEEFSPCGIRVRPASLVFRPRRLAWGVGFRFYRKWIAVTERKQNKCCTLEEWKSEPGK